MNSKAKTSKAKTSKAKTTKAMKGSGETRSLQPYLSLANSNQHEKGFKSFELSPSKKLLKSFAVLN